MSSLEYWGRRLDEKLSRLEASYRLRKLCPKAYEAQAQRVGIAYRYWRDVLLEEPE